MSYSPFCRDEDVIEFCGDNGIAIMCDDPYLKFTQHRNPQLLEIARDVGVNVDEVGYDHFS
jgi:diketogulonate reductase-like aldo/keto reductase